MIFSFYKYLQPIAYFNLKSNQDFGYFPTMRQLDAASFPYSIDANYKSSIAQERDVAWIAFQQGFINKNSATGLDIWKKEAIPVQDESVFLFKNFHKAWVYYVLLIRILTLHNPFSEALSFLKAKKANRFDFSKNHFNYNDY